MGRTEDQPLDTIGGKKFDQNKIRMELIPPELFESVAKVLTFGAKKYGDRNWEKGILWSRVYGALQRHLNSFWSGQDYDEETGMPHLWHAGCCLTFLITYEQRNIGQDDRWRPAKKEWREWKQLQAQDRENFVSKEQGA